MKNFLFRFFPRGGKHDVFKKMCQKMCRSRVAFVGLGLLLGGGLMAEAMGGYVSDFWHEASSVKNGAVTVSLVPPAYMNKRPEIFLSPAGKKISTSLLQNVTEGSRIEVRVEGTEKLPIVAFGRKKLFFEKQDDGSFLATLPVSRGDILGTNSLVVRRGWVRLGVWHLRVQSDEAPQIAMTEAPQVMARYTMKLAFDAADDQAVDRVSVRARLLGVPQAPWSEFELVTPKVKAIKQTVFADLTFMPFAGRKAELQLVAYDAKGQSSFSETRVIDFPTRQFNQPLARALIEERQRLLLNAKNENIRNDVANSIAGMARQTNAYGRDPTVFMGLRSSAVRLVLSRGDAEVDSVAALLWRLATRVEDGQLGRVQDALRQSSQDLGQMLRRQALNGADKTIPRDMYMSFARLATMLSRYMEAFVAVRADQPPSPSDADFILQSENDFLTRGDLYQILDRVREDIERGSFDQAQGSLLRFQMVLENVRLEPPALSSGIKDMLARANALRLLAQAQKKLRDETFVALRDGESKSVAGVRKKLSEAQNMLRQKIAILTQKDKVEKLLEASDAAMGDALKFMETGAFQTAFQRQGEAINFLQKAAALLLEAAQAELSVTVRR